RSTGPLIANGACFAMAVWLILQADSATALAAWILASGVMVLVSRPALARRPVFVHLLVAVTLFIPLFALFLNTGAGLTEYMGRDSTLTGRTDLWRLVLGMTADPFVGTGFESFWLGDRLDKMWR